MITIKIKSKIRKQKFKKTEYTERMKNLIDVQNRQAARAWLREALVHIPTYTGTARGTFKPLGRALRVSVPKFGPAGAQGNLANASKKKYFKYRGRKQSLGFDEGANYSTFEIEQISTVDGLTIRFTFSYDLLYLFWNNMYPAPQWIHLPSNPPWHAIDKANVAWNKYVNEVLPGKLPRISKYLSVK